MDNNVCTSCNQSQPVFRTCVNCLKTWNFMCSGKDNCWHFTQVFNPLNEAWYCFKCKPDDLDTNEPQEDDSELDDVKSFFEDFFVGDLASAASEEAENVEEANNSSPDELDSLIVRKYPVLGHIDSFQDLEAETGLTKPQKIVAKPHIRPSKRRFVCKDYQLDFDHLPNCEFCKKGVEWRRNRQERQKRYLEERQQKEKEDIERGEQKLSFLQRRFTGWCLMNGYGNKEFYEKNPDIAPWNKSKKSNNS